MEAANQVPLFSSLTHGPVHDHRSATMPDSSSAAGSIPQTNLEKIRLREFIDAAERYRPQLIWLAMRIVNRSEEAEDIVQLALLKAFRKLSGFRGDSQMRTWLNAIVKNTAREYTRSQRGRTFVSLEFPQTSDDACDEIDVPDHSMNPEEYYERWERDEIVATAVGGLCPGNRDVIEMCVFQELPYMEVATALNLSLSTVKSRMFRSRRDLRIALSARSGAFR